MRFALQISTLVAALPLIAGTVRPSLAAWPADGRALCVATNDQRRPAIASDGVGGAIVTWTDNRGADLDIYVQHVLASGAVDPTWLVDGRALCTAVNDQYNPMIVSDGAGGAIVTWQDERSGNSNVFADIYAQHVLASGAVDLSWPANGRALCTAPNGQAGLTIVSDGAGGAIVTWHDQRTGTDYDIYAQHVLASGAVDPAWPADGRALCTAANFQWYPTIAADGAGGAIVTWEDLRGGFWHIYAQHVLASGAVDPGWPADGRALCTAVNGQTQPMIVADGMSGAIVAWLDFRNGNDDDIYAQHVLASGVVDPGWPANGRALCTAVNDQVYATIVVDGAGGAFVTWQDFRSGNDYDIYAQHVLASGAVNFLWPVDGISLCSAANDQLNPTITTDGAGGAIITWQDFRNGNYDVYAQRALPFEWAYTPAWPFNGRALCTAASDQSIPTIVADGPGGAIITWEDFRSGTNYDIYAQRVGTPQVSAVLPASGGNAGPVTVSVIGQNLKVGATAKLSGAGQPDIPGTGLTVTADGLSVTATFDLNGRAVGAWNLVVTNPDSLSATLTNGFTITSVTAPQLRVYLLGPPQIRANRSTPFDVVIENSGNVDALYVPLWLTGVPPGVPSDSTVQLGFPLTPPPPGGEPDWSTVPQSFTSPGGRYVPMVIPRVPPGTTVRRFYLKVPATYPVFTIRAAVTSPWVDGTVFRGCLVNGGITAPACMGAQLTAINAYLDATPTIQALSGIGEWAKIARLCEGAVDLPAALAKAEQVLDFMVGAIEPPGSVVPACSQVLPPRWADTLLVTLVASYDPNEKFVEQDTIPDQSLFAYSIQFENDPAVATGDAQRAVISDSLDITKLDPATVRLQQIAFGRTIIPGNGLPTMSTQVDLRPARNLLVNVSAGVDVFAGVVTWYFSTLDPVTGQPPLLEGFLPRNVVSPEGLGSVLFTVKPRPGLANGTPITNAATIKFDDNPAESTLAVTTLLDVGAPASHVLPIAANSDLPSIPVSWGPDSSQLDLKDYTIYVKEDGAPYRVWRQNVTSTGDTLVPPANHVVHQYAFYSVARDVNGSAEAPPGVADATTQSRTAVESGAELQLALQGAWPNPALGTLHVRFTLPNREPATLELMDIAGRRVARQEVGSLGPGSHTVTLAGTPPLRAGLYFIRLVQEPNVLNARAVVVR